VQGAAALRLAIVGLVVAALGLAALAARSHRPFRGDTGGSDRAPSTPFVDSLFTLSLVLLGVLVLIAISVRIGALHTKAKSGGRRSGFGGLVAYLAVIVLVVAAGRHVLNHEKPFVKPGPAGEQAFPQRARGKPTTVNEPVRSPRIIWPLAIGVVVLIGGTAGVLVVLSRRRRVVSRPQEEAVDELVAALDSAIDDLRRDPDPRRAVVAAYARMEDALTVFGLPRRAAETPYEYLARAGRELDAEEAVAALTDLFEVAKFSEHSIDETMRGRAIDALVAVRTEVAMPA
jgi:Domain of unknown function (DUF4129)